MAKGWIARRLGLVSIGLEWLYTVGATGVILVWLGLWLLIAHMAINVLT